MNWKKFSDEMPPMDTPVAVCFEPGNEFSCEFVELTRDTDGELIWWHPKKNYAVDENDYWSFFEVPSPWMK